MTNTILVVNNKLWVVDREKERHNSSNISNIKCDE